ncbi:NarL family two-protein response regulator [Pararhodospirillum oryzae]|uniref:Transcriptional regulator n=1 Tax=Pararhodospirillum oryzae TaxID=478448 RepID=A0A512H788_9PROT|nr:NarL family two-protein response regulator [Pararhodospirillum oryzae]GEO81319.1 transcriptional regulator [Pararhodospirillum oryzae]
MNQTAGDRPDRLRILVAGLHEGVAQPIARRIQTMLPDAWVETEATPLAPGEPRVDLLVMVVGADIAPDDLAVAVGRRVGAAPVLVVLENGNDDLGLVAMSAGAEDWVLGSSFDPQALILRIIWRHRAHEVSRDNAVRAGWEGEADRLGRMISGGTMTVTARSFGSTALRDVLPDLYTSSLRRLNDLVDQAVEDRIYGSGHGVDTELQALADTLGFARAGPRDVIDLYVTVLRARDSSGPAKRRAVMMEELRLLVLQLMGHLANHYRMRVMGAPIRRGEKGYQK